MSTEAAFIRAIVAEPDADEPRLVYADWLEENGDAAGRARAEFIRTQCELAGHDPIDEHLVLLSARADALFAAHGAAWRADVPGWVRAPRFHRGFVEEVELTSSFVFAAENLTDSLPLRRMVLRLGEYDGPVVFGSARLASLRPRSLAVRCPQLTAAAVASLAEAGLPGLVSLDLRNCRLDDDAVRLLTGAGWLGNLTRLDLSHNRIGTAGLEALVEANDLTSLRQLSLSHNQLRPRGIAALCRSRLMSRLRRLDLSHNDLGMPRGAGGGVNGISLLAECPDLSGLTYLNLAGTGISVFEFHELADSVYLGGLAALSLARNLIDDHALEALEQRQPTWPGLTALDLSWNQFGPRGAEQLARWPGLKRIHTLLIKDGSRSPRGGPAGVRGAPSLLTALAGSPYSTGLRVLDHSVNDLTADALDAFARSDLLSRLTALSLSGNPLGHKGALALVEAPSLGRLRLLDLSEAGVNDEMLGIVQQRLAALPGDKAVRLYPVRECLHRAFSFARDEVGEE